MQCINPICIEGRGIFPCGMCYYCRIQRASLWAMRMMHETEYHKHNVFVTLTYNNDWVGDNNLNKRDLQLFIKRLRKNVGNIKIKYFACGEYGYKYGRKHYHLIIFGLGPGDKNVIDKSWQFGFTKVALVTKKRCKYTAKYIMKTPLGRSRREKYLDEREPEFQIQSNGIGLSWIMEKVESIGESGLLYHGKLKAMPRYYVDKIRNKGMSAQFVEDIKAERMQERFELYRKWFEGGMTNEEFMTRRHAQRQTRIEEARTLIRNQKGSDMDLL